MNAPERPTQNTERLTLKSGVSDSGLTMKLRKGLTAGGVVNDEEGNPVANALFFINDFGLEMSQRGNREIAAAQAVAISDAAGQWACTQIPPDLENISLFVIHPEYAGVEVPIRPTEAETTYRGAAARSN